MPCCATSIGFLTLFKQLLTPPPPLRLEGMVGNTLYKIGHFFNIGLTMLKKRKIGTAVHPLDLLIGPSSGDQIFDLLIQSGIELGQRLCNLLKLNENSRW